MRNRYLEAFKESGNILGLATAAALSAALLNPIPLAIGLALELVYLAFVPDMKWYMARLSRLNDADIEKRRAQIKEKMFPHLRPEMQERFLRLEKCRNEIDKHSSNDAAWFREILRKLDFLLEKFLQFAGKEAQFRAYLVNVLEEVRQEEGSSRLARQAQKRVSDSGADVRSSDARSDARGRLSQRKSQNAQPPNLQVVPGAEGSTPNVAVAAGVVPAEDRWVRVTVAEIQLHYDRDMAGVRHLYDQEQDAGTKAVLEKRIEVLTRRREFVGKMGRIMMNLNHQLCLLEDTFGLISDEIRARPPEQVLADIEDVVSQTNTMTQVLEEMAPYEQMLNRISA